MTHLFLMVSLEISRRTEQFGSTVTCEAIADAWAHRNPFVHRFTLWIRAPLPTLHPTKEKVLLPIK